MVIRTSGVLAERSSRYPARRGLAARASSTLLGSRRPPAVSRIPWRALRRASEFLSSGWCRQQSAKPASLRQEGAGFRLGRAMISEPSPSLRAHERRAVRQGIPCRAITVKKALTGTFVSSRNIILPWEPRILIALSEASEVRTNLASASNLSRVITRKPSSFNAAAAAAAEARATLNGGRTTSALDTNADRRSRSRVGFRQGRSIWKSWRRTIKFWCAPTKGTAPGLPGSIRASSTTSRVCGKSAARAAMSPVEMIAADGLFGVQRRRARSRPGPISRGSPNVNCPKRNGMHGRHDCTAQAGFELVPRERRQVNQNLVAFRHPRLQDQL